MLKTDETQYESIEQSIISLTGQRDALAAQIRAALDGAAFDGQMIKEKDAKAWIDQAQALIDQSSGLAAGS